jgi:hypothetical protein
MKFPANRITRREQYKRTRQEAAKRLAELRGVRQADRRRCTDTPAAKPTIPPRSVFAAWVALQDPQLLRARLLDSKVELTPAERIHIAENWGPRKGSRERKRPPLHPILRRSRVLAIAREYIWKVHGESIKSPAAIRDLAELYKCSTRTIKVYVEEVRSYSDAVWQRFYPDGKRGPWEMACHVAAKGDRAKFDMFDWV